MGQLISKSKEKLWDIDIKNFTVSPLDQIKCTFGPDKNYGLPSLEHCEGRSRGLGGQSVSRNKGAETPASPPESR